MSIMVFRGTSRTRPCLGRLWVTSIPFDVRRPAGLQHGGCRGRRPSAPVVFFPRTFMEHASRLVSRTLRCASAAWSKETPLLDLGFPTTRAGAATPQRGWPFHGHRAPHARFRPPLRLAAAHPCGCGSCDPRTSPSREMGAFLGFALQGVSPTTTRCTLMHAPLLAFAPAWPAEQVAPWVGLQGFAIVVDPYRRPRQPKPARSTTDPFLGFVALQSVLPTVPTPTFRIRGVSLHILAWDDVPSSTWISRSRVTAGSPGPSQARQLS